MKHLKLDESTRHEYDDSKVKVAEFDFVGETIMNDAHIILSDRYPNKGYAVNDRVTALITVESGAGTIAIKNEQETKLSIGDRLLIKAGEPYYFTVSDELAIRYTATPAWTPEQSRIIE